MFARIDEIRKKMALRYQALPESLETRIKTAFNAIRKGEIPYKRGAELVFTHFFLRTKLMCQDTPEILVEVNEAVKDKKVGIKIPKYPNLTLSMKTLDNITITDGINENIPTITYATLKLAENILLAKITIVEAVLSPEKEFKLKLYHIPSILEWFAPLAAVQTAETVDRCREAELNLIDNLLTEVGF